MIGPAIARVTRNLMRGFFPTLVLLLASYAAGTFGRDREHSALHWLPVVVAMAVVVAVRLLPPRRGAERQVHSLLNWKSGGVLLVIFIIAFEEDTLSQGFLAAAAYSALLDLARLCKIPTHRLETVWRILGFLFAIVVAVVEGINSVMSAILKGRVRWADVLVQGGEGLFILGLFGLICWFYAGRVRQPEVQELGLSQRSSNATQEA